MLSTDITVRFVGSKLFHLEFGYGGKVYLFGAYTYTMLKRAVDKFTPENCIDVTDYFIHGSPLPSGMVVNNTVSLCLGEWNQTELRKAFEGTEDHLVKKLMHDLNLYW